MVVKQNSRKPSRKNLNWDYKNFINKFKTDYFFVSTQGFQYFYHFLRIIHYI